MTTARGVRLSLGVICAVFLVSRSAAADNREDRKFLWLETEFLGPEAERWSMHMEVTHGWRSQEAASLSVTSPSLALEYGLSQHFALALDWGFALLAESPDEGATDRRVVGGNPSLSGFYREQHETWRWRVGLETALPLARAQEGPDLHMKQAAYRASMAARGLWNLWQWTPDHAALVLPAAIEMERGAGLWLRAEAAAALMLPVRGAESAVRLVWQGATSAGWATGILRAGVRTLAVTLPGHPHDRTQVAIEPLIRLVVHGGYVAARYTINVGEPLGQRRGLRIHAIHIGGGWQL